MDKNTSPVQIGKEQYEKDDFELRTNSRSQFEKTLTEFHDSRNWYTSDEDYTSAAGMPVAKMENVKFFDLPAEPIMAPAILKEKHSPCKYLYWARSIQNLLPSVLANAMEPVIKWLFNSPHCTKYPLDSSVSADALRDSMSEHCKGTTRDVDVLRGTSLMASVDKGNIFPVGSSAIPGLCSVFGLGQKGEQNAQGYDPAKLAELFNILAICGRGRGTTMMTAFGKWRACNGQRYAVTDDLDIWRSCNDMMQKYPLAKFSYGWMSHELTRWVIDLGEYADTLFGQYANVFNKAYTPILIIQTSNTRDSAVNLCPGIRFGNTFVPLSQEVSRRHTCAGNFTERMTEMHNSIVQAFDEVMPRFENAAKDIDALKQIPVRNAYNALLRVMFAIGFPHKESAEQAEIFKELYSVENGKLIVYPNVSAYELFLTLCDTFAEIDASQSYDAHRKMNFADGLKRVYRLPWKEYDTVDAFTWPTAKVQ